MWTKRTSTNWKACCNECGILWSSISTWVLVDLQRISTVGHTPPLFPHKYTKTRFFLQLFLFHVIPVSCSLPFHSYSENMTTSRRYIPYRGKLQMMKLLIIYSAPLLGPNIRPSLRFRGFRLTQLYCNSCLLFYSNYPRHVSVVWMASHVNFRCIYFRLKMGFQPKHTADNLNKTVNNYWNRVALDGKPLNLI
jgi:hypothetical protein